MNVAVDALLAFAVLAAWIGGIVFLRPCTPFERLHVVTFVNIAAGGAITAAAALSDGMSARTLQCIFVWIVVGTAGALLSHAIARALHTREGERR